MRYIAVDMIEGPLELKGMFHIIMPSKERVSCRNIMKLRNYKNYKVHLGFHFCIRQFVLLALYTLPCIVMNMVTSDVSLLHGWSCLFLVLVWIMWIMSFVMEILLSRALTSVMCSNLGLHHRKLAHSLECCWPKRSSYWMGWSRWIPSYFTIIGHHISLTVEYWAIRQIAGQFSNL